MGLNSIGIRMTYEYEECELIHIHDLVGIIYEGMDSCLVAQLGFKFHGDEGDNHVIDEEKNDSETSDIEQAIIAFGRADLANHAGGVPAVGFWHLPDGFNCSTCTCPIYGQ